MIRAAVQDVAGVTQASLRESMGVVPQDTVCACLQLDVSAASSVHCWCS